MIDLSEKTVIITGASKGIGAATAHVFAAAGANLALLARSEAEITAITEEIGPQAIALPCDVSDFSLVSAAVAQVIDTFGGIDVLIGNAGVIEPISPLSAADPAAWGKAIDINLKGVFHGMRAVMPYLLEAGGGTVLTVSSGAAHHPLEGWSHYCAAKAGAAMLTSCAHIEGHDKGLRVMGLSPGTVATDMQREIKASGVGPVAQLDWADHIPPEWPARALLWMCSPDSNAYLGTEIALRDEAIRKRIGLQ